MEDTSNAGTKILYVGDTTSFVSKALVDGFKEAGFDLTDCAPAVFAIERGSVNAQYLFMVVDEEIVDKQNIIIYVRDLCANSNKKVFLMGYPEQLSRVLPEFDNDVIAKVYERPLNAREVITDIAQKIADYEQLKSKLHILVVDDNGTMLRTMKNVLEPKYKVTMVNSALNAMTFLGTTTPDLILLDYDMPVCNGAQMIQMIRSEVSTERIPIFFLTARGDRSSIQEVLKYKPQGYLLKTMSPTEIVDNISAYFVKKGLE